MRIRTIKPEFWRSMDISAIEDWGTRLLFIGLWSYVDDNGVGVDRLALIATDLFPDDVEREPIETFARVSRGLDELAELGRIVRYKAQGKTWLYVDNWTKHQKIDKPAKPRYPSPTSEDAFIRESVASVRETPGAVTGEQGNRGTGEQQHPSGVGAELTLIDQPALPAPVAKSPKRRRTAITPDWKPSPEQVKRSKEEYPHADLNKELKKFIDSHTAKGSLMADWDAAWRTWTGNMEQYGGGRPATGPSVLPKKGSDYQAMRDPE